MRALGFALLLSLAPAMAIAQKNCKKGIPCGNSCIAANKTCRMAAPAPSSGQAPRAILPAVPQVKAALDSARYVASSRGRVFYWIGCDGWRNLSKANVIYFLTAADAKTAGYSPSGSEGCGERPASIQAWPIHLEK